MGVLGVCAAAVLCMAQAPVMAADPAKAPGEWVVRTFSVPLAFDKDAQSSSGLPLSMGNLPDASADKAEWEAHAKVSHEVMSRVLAEQGIPLPHGSTMLYDLESGTLSIHSPSYCSDLIDSYSEQVERMRPRHLELSLEVVETVEDQWRQLLKHAEMKADHAELLAQLKTATPANAQAPTQNLATLRLETTSGHWAKAEQVAWSRGEKPAGAIAGRPEGLRFRARPVIHADGMSVDLDYEFEYGPRSGEGEAQEKTHAPGMTMKSSVSVVEGTTKLLGVWRAPREGADDGPDNTRMRVAFLRMEVVVLKHDINPLVESKLRELVGVPLEAKAEEGARVSERPPGIQMRSYAVPRNILEVGYFRSDHGSLRFNANAVKQFDEPQVPADPFAPQVPDQPSGETAIHARDEDRLPYTSELSMPEGSAVVYVPKASTVVLIHNAEGLNRFAEWVDMMWAGVPRTLVYNVEVIEAEATVLQKISDAIAGGEGHERARDMLEKLLENRKAQMVERHRLEAVSGKPCELRALDVHTGRFELKLTGTPSPDEQTMDLEMTLSQGEGASMNISNASRLILGEPRMVALWKPVGEGDEKKNVLRVAFIKADTVPVEQPAKVEEVKKGGTSSLQTE